MWNVRRGRAPIPHSAFRVPHWRWLCLAVLLNSHASLAAELAAPPVTALAVAPGGKSVLAGSQAGLRQLSWPELKEGDRKDGTPKTALAHIHDLAFSPRGDLLAVAGGAPAEAGIVEVFSTKLKISPDGKAKHRELKFRAEPQSDLIYAVAWSPDGRRLATASYDHTVAILDAASGKRLHKLQGHSRGVLAVCWLPDAKTLVSAGADNSLRVWDAERGRAVRPLDNHTAAVHALAVRPGDAGDAPPLVASVSDDRSVRLWQPTIGRMVRFARLTSAPLAATWSSDGRQLVVGCADGHVRAIDPETLEVLADAKAVDGRVLSVALPRDGGKAGARILVGGSEGQLKAVELAGLN